MDDGFDEKDETIFGGDEVLDYIIYEEVEKELGKKKNNTGCLSSIVLMVSVFGSFVVFALWIVG